MTRQKHSYLDEPRQESARLLKRSVHWLFREELYRKLPWKREGRITATKIKVKPNTFFRTFVRPRVKNFSLFSTLASKKRRHEFFINLGNSYASRATFQRENSLDITGKRWAKWYLKFRYTCGYLETFSSSWLQEKLQSFVDLPDQTTPNFHIILWLNARLEYQYSE